MRDPEEAFWKFVKDPPLFDLNGAKVGTAVELACPYICAATVQSLVTDLAQKATELAESPSGRANAAGVHLSIASQLVLMAILLHLRPYKAGCVAAIGVARMSLEATMLACWIATGTGSEATDWAKNRLKNVPKSQLKQRLHEFLKGARRPVPAVTEVYDWLCSYSHVDNEALTDWHVLSLQELHGNSYAAIAYAALVMALVAELVVGWKGIAEWPAAWVESISHFSASSHVP